MKKTTWVLTVMFALITGINTYGYNGNNYKDHYAEKTFSPDLFLMKYWQETYFAIQTADSMEEAPIAPVAENQSFCGETVVSDIIVTGESEAVFKWYASESGGTALSDTEEITESGTYYVSQTVSGEESERAVVEITINSVPEAPTASAQAFCGSATVGDLEAEGEDGATVNWYSSETGGAALSDTEEISETGTYYVSQTVDGCESDRTSVEVTIKEIPEAPTVSVQDFCGSATVGDLEAEGEDGATVNWYSAETGGAALSDTEEISESGTYYVSQTVDGCESDRTSVEVTIKEVPDAPVASAQDFCGSATVGDLEAEGEDGATVNWYSAETGGAALSDTEEISETGTYYVSQTVDGCESDRTSVEVTIKEIPEAPTASTQAFCGSVTVGDLEAEGEDGATVNWYSSETGGTALLDTEEITESGTYYVSQTVDGCESERISVEVTIKEVPDTPVASAQDFCGSATVGDLEAEGEEGATVNWYSAETGGVALSDTEEITESGTYYVSQTVDDCESERTSVEVTIKEIPEAPTASAQEFDNPIVVGDLEAEGEDGASLSWYASATGGTVLLDTEEITESGTYYVSQTVEGCESERTSVEVTLPSIEYCEVTSTNTSNGISNFKTTNGILNIDNSSGPSPYSDFTQYIVAQFEGGDDVQFTITPVSGTNGMGLWIDWNKDGNFDGEGEHIYNSGSYVSQGTGTITIPPGTPVGNYRMRVVANWLSTSPTPCGDLGNISNGEAEDYTFTVIEQPDCMPPNGLDAEALSLTSVELSWTSDGDSFELEWGEVGFTQGEGELIENLNTTSTTVTTVIDTPYEFYVRRDCGEDELSMWAGPFSFETGYCIPPYQYGCSSGAKISDFETTNAILNISNTTGTSSCGINGYNDFTDLVAAASEGMEVSFGVQVGSYSGGVKLWIDWNGNGSFEEDELIGESASTVSSGAVFSGTFTVPAGVDLGSYRFRVRVVESTTSFGPCTTQNYGEVEDYTFMVIEEPDCMPPTALATGSMTLESAELLWTSDGDSFEIEWAEVDVDQGEGTVVSNVGEPPYLLENLEEGTHYRFYVRQDCGEDGFSLWAGPYYFYTEYCEVSTTYTGDYTSAFSTTNALINLSYSASSQPTGGYADETEQIIMQSAGLSFDFSTTYVGGPNGVNIWIDYDHSLTFEDSEKVFSLANSDATKTGTITIPIDTPIGEYRMRVRSQYGSSVDPPACGNVSYGSTIDFTLHVVEPPACMPPSDVAITHTSEDSVTVSWTAVEGQDTWQVLVLPTGSPAPDEDTVGFEVTSDNPFTVDGLDPNTDYVAYVRADCGEEDGVSFWVGPAEGRTTQIPAELPYEEDFEGADNWGYLGSHQDNEWVIGTAVSNGGTHALYVSEDEGVSHTYNTSGAAVLHAYRDFFVEEVSGELEISFDWLCNGEGFSSYKYDYLNVWIVPASYSPTENALITNGSNGVNVVNQYNGNEEEFLEEFIILDINNLHTAFDSGYFRIVFEWRNDSSGGNQPPAAIDNLLIKKVTCPPVIDLQSEIVEDGDAVIGALLTWTPVGEEEQWEVFILPFEDETIPDENTTGVVVDNPQYFYEEGSSDAFYRFYVRPLCSDEDQGRWSEPGVISFIPPPGCAEVEAEVVFSDVEGLEPNAKGDYVICQDEPVQLTLGATYYDIPGTETYEVETIEYKPPFPFTGGGAIELTVDDEWSDVIDLGFDFCFFGNNYKQILISTNGIITFSIAGVVDGGRYSPGNNTIYYPSQEIPYIPAGNSGTSPTVNSIFGVFQDLDPSQDNWNGPQSPEDYSINYQIVGKAPCRTLVFNIYHLGLFSCGYDENDVESSTQTSQIVLYEGTNIIEVYVKNRPMCMDWGSGRGLIGIQGSTIDEFAVPEGRNTGNWTAHEEAWRFSPSGESIAEFSWEKDGEFFSSESEIEISVNESAKYVARAKYELCGEEFNLYKEFNFVKENFAIGTPQELVDCSRKPGELNEFQIRDNDAVVLGDLDPERYLIEYFESEEDLAAGENALPDVVETQGGSKTIYVKLTNLNTGCYKSRAVSLKVMPPVKVGKLEDRSVCDSYELPELEEGEAYYTEPYGGGVRYEGGEVFSEIGVHTIYIYKVDEMGCFGQSEFTLEIVETPVADVFKDEILECETYVLKPLSENNKYFTEPNGQGGELPVGYEVKVPMTIYVYASVSGKSATSAVCTDESSFTIDYVDCPFPRGISPNGDGLNDSLDLRGYGVTGIQIFNRYGLEVYSYGYDYTDQWHGQDKSGNPLPDGTYYMVVVSNGKVRTGWIQINR